MGIKKGTKLTDSPKSHMLRVRMDNESMMKLDVICETKNITRSEVVREGIEQQYAKLKK
ncbi:CopG family transcriptional regulator [Massilioclostridium coli]|mgnify:CR=1 FL=1|uniref:CopG family transcriptional regulator n=1 Tax=Massilioclostridium coli TaxID=1870991 RepID=UPI00114CDDC4|nr:CopG family transcriptional regulator [Massilioclostridium coli]